MKLSKRGEYGLKALIDLASQGNPQSLVQIRDIAQRQQIPVKFLEQIMLAMKNGGILRSRAGIGGGYYLARPADEITLGQVVRLLEGPLAPIACVSQMAYERCVCENEATCGLRLAMLDVRNAIANILDKTTLADVSTRVERAQRAGKRPARRSAKRPTAKATRR
jgi:Rrf2 family protein